MVDFRLYSKKVQNFDEQVDVWDIQDFLTHNMKVGYQSYANNLYDCLD